MDEFVIGTIGKSHGLKGHVKVRSLSGENSHFLKLTEVSVTKRGVRKTLRIDSVAENGSGMLIIKFTGIDTPEAAKIYATWDIVVPREKGAALKKGEHYIADLRGCSVAAQGLQLGIVHDFVDGPLGLFAEIRTEGQSFLVPYTDMYFGDVDIKTRCIEFLAPWVLE